MTPSVQACRQWEVGHVAAELAELERGQHCVGIDQFAAREVQQHRAVLHAGEVVGVDHAARGVHQRHVQRHYVGAGQQLIKVDDMHRARQLQRVFDRQERVIAVHVHVECAAGIGDHGTYGAQAYDGQLFALELGAYELALALFYECAHLVALTLERARPFGAADYIAAGQQHAGDDQFLDGVGVGAGGIEHNYALL